MKNSINKSQNFLSTKKLPVLKWGQSINLHTLKIYDFDLFVYLQLESNLLYIFLALNIIKKTFSIVACLFLFLYRYYRLWIYTCNAVLLMAVIIFCGVAGKVLLADYRRLLINGLNLTQPSFVYAYLALLVQSGKENWFFL